MSAILSYPVGGELAGRRRTISSFESELFTSFLPVLEIHLISESNSKHSDVMGERRKTLLPSPRACTTVSLESDSLPRNSGLLVGC